MFLLKPYISGFLLPTTRKDSLDVVLQGVEGSTAATACDPAIDGNQDAKEYISGICGYLAFLLSRANIANPFIGIADLQYSGFRALVAKCWEIGIPVIFLRAVPKSFPSLRWCIVKGDKPYIFLGDNYEQESRQAVYLIQALAQLNPTNSPIGVADVIQSAFKAKWTHQLLFEKEFKPLEVPCSPEKVLAWASIEYKERESEAVVLLTEHWGVKYLSFCQMLLNRLEEKGDIIAISDSIFYDYIYPHIQKFSLPVQFFLLQLLAPGDLQLSKKEREYNLVQTSIDNLLSEGCSQEQIYTAKELAGILKIMPLKFSFKNGILTVLLSKDRRIDIGDSKRFNLFWDSTAPCLEGDLSILPHAAKGQPYEGVFLV